MMTIFRATEVGLLLTMPCSQLMSEVIRFLYRVNLLLNRLLLTAPAEQQEVLAQRCQHLRRIGLVFQGMCQMEIEGCPTGGIEVPVVQGWKKTQLSIETRTSQTFECLDRIRIWLIGSRLEAYRVPH